MTSWCDPPIGYLEAFQAIHRVIFFRIVVYLPIVVVALIAFLIGLGGPFGGPVGGLPRTMIAVAAGLIVAIAVFPTWATVTLMSTGARPVSLRWGHLGYLLILLFALALLIIGGLTLVVTVVLGGPFALGRERLALVGAAIGLVLSAGIVRYFFPRMYRLGLIDWVTSSDSSITQKTVEGQEEMATYLYRSKMLRKQYGFFWWLRPRLRRWSRGKD